MKYELIVIWQSGEKDIYPYESEDAAEKGKANMKMAFGNQISWMGINKK